MNIYVDGSADNMNKQAPSYTAVLVAGKPVIIQDCTATTNNEAEYTAVIRGIVIAQAYGLTGRATIISDSQLIVNQIKGAWKCKEARLRDFRDRVLAQAKVLPTLVFDYEWRRREENEAGIELEKFTEKQKRRRKNESEMQDRTD